VTDTQPAAPSDAEVPDKGLARDSIGLLGSVTIGLASTAPAYSLAATVGFIVLAVGVQAPAAMLLAFVPMWFTAVAYRELNREVPDCGTTFTWGTKAFGPWIGWMGGWGIVATGIIFMANGGDIVGQYTFELLGRDDLAASKLAVGLVGVAFIWLMTWITYLGVEASTRVQYVLVALQVVVLGTITVLAVTKALGGEGFEGAEPFSWSWLNPFQIPDASALVASLLLAIYIYWGWDTTLSINEETSDATRTPGRAALISTVLLLAIYVSFTVAALMYAGAGDAGLGNEDNAADVMRLVAEPLLGSVGTSIALLTVLVSTAAAMQTTIMPTARGALSMATYEALPARFKAIHPRYRSPWFATVMMGVVATVFYAGAKAISDDLLQDTILSLGLGISFYYGITAFSAVWYFRRESFVGGPRAFLYRFLLPLLGGVTLTWAFVKSAIDMYQPDYGTTTIWGIGGVFVMGIGALAVGVVLMVVWELMAPRFFRGETLRRETPVLAPEG
jgi:amino acid transporter